MKDKSKPDYTKFMKKPAPLEAPPHQDTLPEAPPADTVSDQCIPWAEIVSIDEQHSHKKDQTVYFEIVTDAPDALENGAEAVGLKPEADTTSIGRARGRRLHRTDKQAVPPAMRAHQPESVTPVQARGPNRLAYEPPPFPLLLSPILLALLALYLQ